MEVLMGKSSLNCFLNSYVKLPEGITKGLQMPFDMAFVYTMWLPLCGYPLGFFASPCVVGSGASFETTLNGHVIPGEFSLYFMAFVGSPSRHALGGRTSVAEHATGLRLERERSRHGSKVGYQTKKMDQNCYVEHVGHNI
jgi:hypothetical protein